MGSQLSSQDMRLYRLCDEALFYVWDPIGVRDAPEARTEYQSYLPTVFALVRVGDRQPLLDYLSTILGDSMGLRPDPDAAARAADFMLRARTWIAAQEAS